MSKARIFAYWFEAWQLVERDVEYPYQDDDKEDGTGAFWDKG